MPNDKLTDLLYYDDFKEKAPDLIRSQTDPCMLVSMNISNFKYINNVYGYEKGDQLLTRVADYFFHGNKHCLLASRIHSDRFVAVVVLSKDADMNYITEYCDRIYQKFVHEIEQEYPMAVLRMNTGAYLIHDREENISQILDKAEIARRSIRDDYTSTVCFFTEALEKKAEAERSIVPLFEHALKEENVLVYLQPKIDIDTQKIIGAEALARMMDENGKIIPPDLFVPALEKYGLVSQLDMYVAEKVFQLLHSWKMRGMPLVPISLNLSRVDFKQTTDWEHLMERMDELEVPKEYIEFEVTETAFFEDISLIMTRVRMLRERGFRISMDDFGTGFSSLNALGMLPLDCIKFDRGFVQNSINNRKGLEIMAGLVDIFDRIDLDVICEGVETVNEEQIIRACGCKQVQGYLHDRPLPITDFEQKYLVKAAQCV